MLRLSRAALSLLSHGPSGSVAGGFAAVAASGVGVQRMYVHGGRGNSFVVSATPAEKEEDDFHVGSEGEGEGVEESSTFNSVFKASDLQVIRSRDRRPVPSSWSDIKFGRDFTPHVFSVKYSEENGWETPYIKPFENVSIHPASQVLHYGSCAFEGMKAYAGPNGEPLLFRPELNTNRLLSSATRLTMPAFDPAELLKCVKELVLQDQDWLPKVEGHSLYIRPLVFGTGSFIGIGPVTDAEILVLMSPVGPYFSSGFTPINLFLEEEMVRAPHGGTGQYKVGGNYAPTLDTMRNLKPFNCSQALYTTPGSDSSSRSDRLVAECAAMNTFFLIEHGGERELVTPPLNGTILPGVTRDSVLGLCREWNEFRVSEREMKIEELCAHARNGNLIEVFGTGTACVVQPVSSIVKNTGEVLGTNNDKPIEEWVTSRILNSLEQIQYGHVKHQWSHPIQ